MPQMHHNNRSNDVVFSKTCPYINCLKPKFLNSKPIVFSETCPYSFQNSKSIVFANTWPYSYFLKPKFLNSKPFVVSETCSYFYFRKPKFSNSWPIVFSKTCSYSYFRKPKFLNSWPIVFSKTCPYSYFRKAEILVLLFCLFFFKSKVSNFNFQFRFSKFVIYSKFKTHFWNKYLQGLLWINMLLRSIYVDLYLIPGWSFDIMGKWGFQNWNLLWI